jgi:hypothetical protein
MADPVMSDPPFRRILECVGERYQTVIEINKRYTELHPPELEAFIKISDTLRKMVFKEKKDPETAAILSRLEVLGYVQEPLDDYYQAQQTKGVVRYCLTDKGRSALYSVGRKRT